MAVKALMTDETGKQIVDAIREKAGLEARVSDLEKNKVDKSSIAQTTGSAEDKVMSQNAVTEDLEKKFDKSNVVQSTGDAEDKVMSQAAATKEFAQLSEEISNFGGLVYQREGKNIFNENADGAVIGAYIDTSGNNIEAVDWNISDYIDVRNYETIIGSVWRADGTYKTICKLSLMHKYDANKTHLGKVWEDSISNKGIYTVEDGVSYIRFCWNVDVETANGEKIMVENGTVPSSDYEPYTEHTELKNSPYPKMEELKNGDFLEDKSIGEAQLSEEVQAKLNSFVENDDNAIVAFGDSLTYSQYSSGDAYRYPYLVGEKANLPVYNFGMPGANSMDIAGLQGGMPIYLAPFTLPADTSQVTVTLIDAQSKSNYIGLLHHMPRPQWVNSIQTMGLTWIIDNIPVNLIYSGGLMKVYRINAGNSDITFDRPIRITPVHVYAHNQIQLFWVGTNDAPTTPEKAQRTVDIIKNMVSFSNQKRFLVLGMTVKEYADITNDLLAQTFGLHYVDVKNYLIKYGLADNDISATDQDTTDIENGVVPTSLRYDSVHFNDYGYAAVANCVYQHGKDLGYWD